MHRNSREQTTNRGAVAALPPELRYFLSVSAVLFLLSTGFVAYHFHFDPSPSHGLIPTLLASPFSDLNAFAPNVAIVHQIGFFLDGARWVYPAPCVFLYKFLLFAYAGLPVLNLGYSDALYLCCVCMGLFFLMSRLAQVMKANGLSARLSWSFLAGSALLSWPVFFAVRQGNVEAIIWIGVAVAVWAIFHDRWWMAAILLGLVAGFKIYPLLILGLFLKPRRFKEMAVSLLCFVLFSLAGLAYIGPTVAVAFSRDRVGMKIFTDLAFYPDAIDRNYLALEHSVVSLFRIFTTAHPEYMLALSRYYMPLAAAFMTAFFFIFVWKLPRTNQLMVIVLAIVLLPPKSYDYTLQMLYIPWACLLALSISSARRGRRVPGLAATMILLALICSPEVFIKYGGYYSGGQFKTICLLGLLFVAARYPFPDDAEKDGSIASGARNAILAPQTLHTSL